MSGNVRAVTAVGTTTLHDGYTMGGAPPSLSSPEHDSPLAEMPQERRCLGGSPVGPRCEGVDGGRQMTEKSHIPEDIVENLPVGVIVVDREMHVTHLNRTAERLTGYASSDVVGKRLPDLFGPELWAENSALQQAMETGRRVEPRVSLVTQAAASDAAKAGRPSSHDAASLRTGQQDRRRLLVGAAPISSREGHLISLVLMEISAFYQLEADRISDISHDIRSPLASICAYTELLIDEVDDGNPELRREFLDVIDQRTRHLADLIVNLTSLVRQDLGYLKMNKTPVSLHDAAEAAVAALQVQARQKDVRLVLDAGDHDGGANQLIMADQDALSILLKNVIGNAVKFSEAGADVIVSLRHGGQGPVVTVADSGIGIPAEDLPHIFDVFHRGGNAVAFGIEGSGMGLALAKAIAEAHGGAIDVESAEGKGTSVTITLP